MKKILVGVVTASAVALAAAPSASADEMSYLQTLNAAGFTIYNTQWALASGHSICNALNYDTGDVVAVDVFVNSSWTDVPSLAHAGALVLIAVSELCPWHDHTGTVIA
jgi:hypothetical protein